MTTRNEKKCGMWAVFGLSGSDLVTGSSTKGNGPSDFLKWGISLSAEQILISQYRPPFINLIGNHDYTVAHGCPTCDPPSCVMRPATMFVNYVYTIKLHNNLGS